MPGIGAVIALESGGTCIFWSENYLPQAKGEVILRGTGKAGHGRFFTKAIQSTGQTRFFGMPAQRWRYIPRLYGIGVVFVGIEKRSFSKYKTTLPRTGVASSARAEVTACARRGKKKQECEKKTFTSYFQNAIL